MRVVRGVLLALVAVACSNEASTPLADTPATAQPDPQATVGDGIPDAAAPPIDAGDARAPSGAAPCGAIPASQFAITSAAEGPSCTVFRPATLGAGGVRHPVIVWGNGTTAVVALYKGAFELWAANGFIVAAANASNGQGSGKPLVDCLDYVLAHYKEHACARAAATGHSQGGGGALMAGRDPRVLVTAPLQPYIQQGYGGFDQASITKQTGPMLLLSGEKDDNAVPAVHQKPVFEKTNVPVVWATLLGGDHYSPAIGGVADYRDVMLAWFRLHLMGDASQKMMFEPSKWSVQKKGLP